MSIKKRKTIIGTKKETTIEYSAEIVKRYLNIHSLARNILEVDFLNGRIPNYGVSDDMTLDDISIVVRGANGMEVVSGSHLAAHGQGNDFWLPTWEFSVWNDNPTGEEDIDEKLLEKIKLEMLKEEESIFINFIKHVMKNNDRYIICDNNDDAIEKINKIEYKKMWAGEKIKISMPNLQKIRSSHLEGIILAHSNDSNSIGIFAIRQQPCMLHNRERNKIVSFEEQAMMVINKELTYIEVKN